ncbi:MAG TPA: hypothetical protein PLN56_10305 [Methanoregulaceae archaeon]|nr:hypothetical protein [Methanoregulaceae archaeon]HPD11368.1 hypothetical protein [Methanoregulaceae archaeon]
MIPDMLTIAILGCLDGALLVIAYLTYCHVEALSHQVTGSP